MIMDYSYFGDVVTFDTTYSTNKECRPLGVFIGFNHHRGIVVFGASLLYDETSESFEWLFRTFLEAHNNKKPMTIFTDQDHAMASALPKIMPNVHHGLCTWHIMQNAIKNVGNIKRDNCSLLKDFKRCMYKYGDEKKFEEAWETIIDHYNVKENRWLKGMYEKKEKWAKCYMKEVYTLGMRSTQLSESLNGDLKDYLKSDLDIIHFFKNFERVIEDKRYNELKAEFDSRQKLPRVRMHKSPMLQQVAQVYTPSLFNLFQEEFDWSLSAIIKYRKENYPINTYVVTMFNQEGEYTITSNHLEKTVSCSCKKFETCGILCGHSLKVLDVLDVKLVPEQYIIKRWTREAKNGSVQDARGQTVQLYANLSETQRYRSLCPKLVKLASRASESQEACELLERLISEVSAQIESICITQTKESVDDSGVDGSSSDGKGTKENDGIHMNVQGLKKKVGQKGRRRIKSSLEKQSKQSKKKRVQSEENIMHSKLTSKDELDSVANVLFEKVKGLLNIHPQTSMNNNNSFYHPVEGTMLFDQGLHSHSLFHGSQASHTFYNSLATEKEN